MKNSITGISWISGITEINWAWEEWDMGKSAPGLLLC